MKEEGVSGPFSPSHDFSLDIPHDQASDQNYEQKVRLERVRSALSQLPELRHFTTRPSFDPNESHPELCAFEYDGILIVRVGRGEYFFGRITDSSRELVFATLQLKRRMLLPPMEAAQEEQEKETDY